MQFINIIIQSCVSEQATELRAYLSAVDELKPTAHAAEFWFSASTQFPKLSDSALTCLSVSVNSVAAERSFSLYSDVLRDDRRSISSENLPKYNMLYQNAGKL